MRKHGEFIVYGPLRNEPKGCLCDSPGYNTLCAYNDKGQKMPLEIIMMLEDLMIFYKGKSIGWLNARFCPFCGREFKQ